MKAERIKRLKFTLAFGPTGTLVTAALPTEGIVHNAHVNVPNFTNAVTAQLVFADVEDLQYYKSSALAKNAEHQLIPDNGIPGDGKVGILLSGDAGGSGGSVVVVLMVKAAGA